MHFFDPNVAAEYGITEAVIINHFQFWIKTNKRKEINEFDGRTWTYTTVREMAEWFDYLSEKQIWTAINKLVEAGVLMKGNYNKTQYDRTTWYAFTLESFWIRQEGEFHFPKRENPERQKVEPIPDYSTNGKTNGKTTPAPNGTGDPKHQKKRVRKSPEEADRDWQRWVDRYDEHVKKFNDGAPHHWNGQQLGPQGLKGIRAHLVKIANKQEGKSPDDCGFAAWSYILDSWEDLPDEWIRGQFDLTVILKKITDILNRLKNAADKNRGSSTSGRPAGTSQQRVDAVRNY